jgi:hypothetical protein
MHRDVVYIGTKLKALVAMKPLMLQVTVLPIAHGLNTAPFGGANGPVKIAND